MDILSALGTLAATLDRLQFASDAERLALTGIACWAGAALCAAMERYRGRRRSIDRLERVGWVPWTSLFVAFAIIGGGCLATSLPVVLGGL